MVDAPLQTRTSLVRNLRELGVRPGDFPALGRAFEAASARSLRIGNVGAGTARLLSVTSAVAFATIWLARHRQAPGQRPPGD